MSHAPLDPAIAAKRLDSLRSRMKQTATNLVALGPSSHMAWLSGVNPHGDERPVLLIVTADFCGFLMPALNVESARASTDLPFFTWSDDEGPAAALEALLEEAGAKKPGLSVVLDETMRADFALFLLDALDSPKRRFTEDTIGLLRTLKDEDESRRIKAAHLLNDAAVAAAFASLKVGMSEKDVEDLIAAHYKKNGAEMAFCAICFGENSAYPHHNSGNTTLKDNMPVLIDTGCILDGYPSDMTRTDFFGTPDEEFCKVFCVVEDAVTAALAAAKAGAKAQDVDLAARNTIAAAGYGDYFLHRCGHGLGIDIHEPPYITATSDRVLEEGNVFSIEPGIYLAGHFGVRLEEIVILKGDGCEIYSEMSRAMKLQD
ncbi:Xaa-Pro aminopeptidase [Cohaesibacter sp. ES.047]|uniref:M24 family metallopeptidase n=1 Tax=Cohaesibacter sp. ES.047 TaxID=1798205 RepID=UPI000BB76FC7|nr:M24 family metallopeptidase [Cohaesibacter sp. ES.047]SNY90188.1 Xaa-Pro aminopeptidase [Cohaesibacter sp. ES.047]